MGIVRIEHQFAIGQLAERLVLSRSTIYYWVRDLLNEESKTAKDLREAARFRAINDVAQISAVARAGLPRQGMNMNASSPILGFAISCACASLRDASASESSSTGEL